MNDIEDEFNRRSIISETLIRHAKEVELKFNPDYILIEATDYGEEIALVFNYIDKYTPKKSKPFNVYMTLTLKILEESE